MLVLLGGTGCKPDRSEKTSASKTRTKELKVEIRSGIAYEQGKDQPFTGDAIDVHKKIKPRKLARRTPYKDGLKHGAVSTYTAGGKLREERKYVNGVPVSSDVYHGNGKKKMEVVLNRKDVAEGPYRRWYDNGVMEAEGTFDENEQFHGVFKTYDRDGKLTGEYRREHGVLAEVLFETEPAKVVRVANETELLRHQQESQARAEEKVPPKNVPPPAE